MALTLFFPTLSQIFWDPFLVIKKTSNNQRLWSQGVSSGRSKRFFSNAVRMFHVMDGENTRDQIANCRKSKRE